MLRVRQELGIEKLRLRQELWNMPDEAFLDPAQTAIMVGCSVSRLAHWRSARENNGPKFRKRGKFIYYKIADIKYWFDTMEESSV